MFVFEFTKWYGLVIGGLLKACEKYSYMARNDT